MIGNQLGWLDVPAPFVLAISNGIILFVSFLTEEGGEKPFHISEKDRKILGMILIINSILPFLAEYIQWTAHHHPIILGVQGRYFLPLLIEAYYFIRPNGSGLYYGNERQMNLVICSFLINCFIMTNLFMFAI